ncbi:MAG: glycosyltransferase family 4 protein [Lachnospiraceae bacterium]|nr:glycosyltransferase family 4 protein [Lachnospiraceae bacterium]
MEQLIFLTLSLTKGGAERVICNMCNEHFVKQYRVTIISLMAAEPEYDLNPDITVLYVDKKPEQYRQNMAVRFARRRKGLASLLKKVEHEGGRIGALISFLPEPNFLITSLSPRRGYPVIISVRNDPAKEYASKVRHLLMKLLYRRADGYVFQTREARDYFSFSTHIIKNSAVIPNPLGKEFLDVPVRAFSEKEIVSVGRLEPQKAPLLLIHAFAGIHAEFPEYRLLFYGEGSLREEMQEEIKKAGLDEKIVLKGNTDRIRDDVGQASLFVLPSVYEGMPNALMEAMALGVPCVATDCPCGGPRSLIKPGENGILVPVGDEQELGRAMADLLRNLPKAALMGRRAQEITKELAPERIYQQWDGLIEAKKNRKQAAGNEGNG